MAAVRGLPALRGRTRPRSRQVDEIAPALARDARRRRARRGSATGSELRLPRAHRVARSGCFANTGVVTFHPLAEGNTRITESADGDDPRQPSEVADDTGAREQDALGRREGRAPDNEDGPRPSIGASVAAAPASRRRRAAGKRPTRLWARGRRGSTVPSRRARPRQVRRLPHALRGRGLGDAVGVEQDRLARRELGLDVGELRVARRARAACPRRGAPRRGRRRAPRPGRGGRRPRRSGRAVPCVRSRWANATVQKRVEFSRSITSLTQRRIAAGECRRAAAARIV